MFIADALVVGGVFLIFHDHFFLLYQSQSRETSTKGGRNIETLSKSQTIILTSHNHYRFFWRLVFVCCSKSGNGVLRAQPFIHRARDGYIP